MFRLLAFLATLLVAGAAQATLIDLSAGPQNPNAGPASYQSYATPNPVIETLAAGTYLISVVGTPGGGLYDAFTISTSNGSNTVFSDGFHYAINGGADQRVVTGVNYTSAAGALAAYRALAPATFTLTDAGSVAFYLNDGSYPYFGDDSGGVSLSLTQQSVPEPRSVGMFVMAMGLAVALHFGGLGKKKGLLFLKKKKQKDFYS